MKYIIAGPTIINDVEFTLGFKENKSIRWFYFLLGRGADIKLDSSVEGKLYFKLSYLIIITTTKN